jgi:hypothetical protein
MLYVSAFFPQAVKIRSEFEAYKHVVGAVVALPRTTFDFYYYYYYYFTYFWPV